VVLIDQEGFFGVRFQHRLSRQVNRCPKLLLELDRKGLLKRLEATAAGLLHFQAKPGPHQNAGPGPYELDLAADRLRPALSALQNAVNLVMPRGADAFLDKT
jgi:hypothetical protein